ncbi:hypothetical protein [Burkholderia sp. LMG 32019]|uniref:hypothetical protein n=1 Tax=Burkholderia sp. LMG 32019 TaxID=3158173 RepID=UPI003C3020FF
MSISSISTGAVTSTAIQGNTAQRTGNSTPTSSTERTKHVHGHHHAAGSASSNSTDGTTSSTGSTAASNGTPSTYSLAGAALGGLIDTSA